MKTLKPEDFDKMQEELAPLIALWMRELSSPFYHDKVLAIALDRMLKYKAHIRAGFTEAQALDLCSK